MIKRLALFVFPALILLSIVAGFARYLGVETELPVQPASEDTPSPDAGLSAMPAGLPDKADNFLLLDQSGQAHELSRYARDAKAIVLYSTATGCPIARQSVPLLKAIVEQFEPQGVVFLQVNASPYDTRESVAQEAEEFGLDLPVLMDVTQFVSMGLRFERTCEAVVIDPVTFAIAYRGAISDQLDYTARRPEATHEWLRDALTAFLAGQPVATVYSAAKGCLIDYAPLPDHVSYANDIAPLIKDHCVACHREGDIAPFAFESYRDVSGRTRMIREVLLAKRMPPWHADPLAGAFRNDRSLSVEEQRTLLAWLEAGAPQDGEADPLEVVADGAVPEWGLGEPDLLVELPTPQTIPASGVVDYRYISVPSGLTEDRWLRAVEVRPSNRTVTHHVLVFLEYPPERAAEQPEYEGGLSGYFASYLPGGRPEPFPEDTGKFIPAGCSFEFQLHYTATGKEETDHTRMALYFRDTPPLRESVTRAASTTDFLLPPANPEVPCSASHFIARDSVLFGFAPHMHYRGKWFRYELELPDGTRQLLLSVPDYDFNWQTEYVLQEPLPVPGGSKIIATGAWDNSVRNPQNPDPAQTVVFGEQSFDEMFIGYVNYSFDPKSEAVPRERKRRERVPEGIHTGIPLDAKTIIGSEWNTGKHRLRFEAEDLLHVDDTVQGSYTIEGGTLKISVAAQYHEFALEGDLITSGGRPLQRLK